MQRYACVVRATQNWSSVSHDSENTQNTGTGALITAIDFFCGNTYRYFLGIGLATRNLFSILYRTVIGIGLELEGRPSLLGTQWCVGIQFRHPPIVSRSCGHHTSVSVKPELFFRNGWVIQSGEIRYVPTPCISKLSISLHLVRSGFIEIYYKMPKNSRGLLAELTVRNEQCQSYG